jgi:hypothetical protein
MSAIEGSGHIELGAHLFARPWEREGLSSTPDA